MSVEVLVERHDEGNAPTPIDIGEWKEILEADPQLRMHAEAYHAIHPTTGEQLTIRAGEADAEIHVDGKWLPFLRFRRGALMIKYQSEFENPENELRKKIAQIARQLRAVVTSDASDDALEW